LIRRRPPDASARPSHPMPPHSPRWPGSWAIARGCERMVIATRLAREQAHAFDAREGYAVSKTSYFLTKALT